MKTTTNGFKRSNEWLFYSDDVWLYKFPLSHCFTVELSEGTYNSPNSHSYCLNTKESKAQDHSCQPTRWASYPGTKCGPSARTPRCGSAPCCSCCRESRPPPWLTVVSACRHTSWQIPQSRCRLPHTPPSPLAVKLLQRSAMRISSWSRCSRPLAQTTSSTRRGQLSPMRPSISLLTARPK